MKVALVVQRYGGEIVGGAEVHARKVANILAEKHDVTVVTTTASDYVTWCSHFPAGEEEVEGVRVLRFEPDFERRRYWNNLESLIFYEINLSNFATVPPEQREVFLSRLGRLPHGFQEELIKQQGPHSTPLLHWLKENSLSLDAVLFFCYLYSTTYYGIECVPSEKIYLVPTLHDEPMAYLPAYTRVFSQVHKVLFSTLTESRLAQEIYGYALAPFQIIGYGIEGPRGDLPVEPLTQDPYMLYCGRIDGAKGCSLLLDYFIRLKAERPSSPLKLILIGRDVLGIPGHPDIVYRGFVSEEDKYRYMRDALCLVQPSTFESLGLVLLEAFLCRTPVLVNGHCQVLVDHCEASGGGVSFTSYEEFARWVHWFLEHKEERKQMGERGRVYVEQLYSLPSYKERLFALFP